jgi:hypothetical protein
LRSDITIILAKIIVPIGAKAISGRSLCTPSAPALRRPHLTRAPCDEKYEIHLYLTSYLIYIENQITKNCCFVFFDMCVCVEGCDVGRQRRSTRH